MDAAATWIWAALAIQPASVDSSLSAQQAWKVASARPVVVKVEYPPTRQVIQGVHSHRCVHCRKSFTHEDYNLGDPVAHTCPHCRKDSGRPWPKTWQGTELREVPIPKPAPRHDAYCPPGRT